MIAPRYPSRMLSELFRCFRRGTSWLLAFPGWFAALVLLGTLLGALGPWIEARTGLPDNLGVETALTFVTTLPLALYALPRFVLRVDASTGAHPSNTADAWVDTFEARWLPMVGAKVLVGLGVGLGLLMLVVPGLMILAAFGWAPSLVLLRGFPLRRALRGSLHIMALHGPRVIFVAVGAFLFTQIPAVGGAVHFPGPGAPLTRLARFRLPSYWGVDALSNLLMVWYAGTLLALFQSVEGPAHEAEAADEEE